MAYVMKGVSLFEATPCLSITPAGGFIILASHITSDAPSVAGFPVVGEIFMPKEVRTQGFVGSESTTDLGVTPEVCSNVDSAVCHNPIFTPGIFSGAGTQNEAARTKPIRPDRDPPHQKSLEIESRAHFPKFGESLPDTQRVDLQARVRWKEDMFRHNMELSDRQAFPQSSLNLDRKNGLRQTKNTPVASVRGTISHKLKLSFPVFPTHNELISEPECIGKMATPATSCNSRFAGGFPRLAGIFAGKTHKNSSVEVTSDDP
uniref:Uncharacterized protein n=1 Tax=Fagus sylvatica TaxID=28930 RepID=A0A2N9GAJ9_FAGSY